MTTTRMDSSVERGRAAFRRWIELLMRLEPDYREEQLELFGDIEMSELGELWGELKERRREKKLERLQAADDSVWMKHTEYHWSRVIAGKKMDYWPSTGKVRYNGKTFEFGKKRYQEILSKNNLEK